MNTTIKAWCDRLNAVPRAKEWVWFAALWCGGLFTALAMAYPIKWLIRHM
jgi:hypothetical protein